MPARKQVSDQQKSIKGWWAFHKQLAAGHWLHCSDSLDPLCVAGVPWQIPARLMIFSEHFFFIFTTSHPLLLIRLRHRALCLPTQNYSHYYKVCAFLSFSIAFPRLLYQTLSTFSETPTVFRWFKVIIANLYHITIFKKIAFVFRKCWETVNCIKSKNYPNSHTIKWGQCTSMPQICHWDAFLPNTDLFPVFKIKSFLFLITQTIFFLCHTIIYPHFTEFRIRRKIWST